MKWRLRGSLGLALLALGATPVALSSGCGGGASLADRLTRLAGTYQGVGTLSGADASLSLTVAADGAATGTLAASGASTALSGRVTSAGALALTGASASVQGTLSESGGTVSVLLGAARASIALARPTTPTGTPTPSPSPTPTPTPEPGPSSLSAALFPLHTGDIWRWSVTGGTENNQSTAVGVEAARDGRNVLPVEWRDSSGRPLRRDYVPTNQSGGYGIIEQEQVLPTDGATLSRTVFGQSLLVSYVLARGQEGPTNTLGGSRSSAPFLGAVSVTFAASFVRGERVSVGAGTFDCAVVRTVQTTGYTQSGAFQSETSDVTEWRAEGVGLVKRTEGGIVWTLDSATVDGKSYP